MNVNQITNDLRLMDDRQLAQFGQMHKNDPFLFPLAFNESSFRKQVRAQGQSMAERPMPPVNDQALMQMQQAAQPAPPPPTPVMPPQRTPLPEDVGIGQLPAGEVVGKAGGGIVAFSGETGEQRVKDNFLTQQDVQKAYNEWQAAKGPWYLPEPMANSQTKELEQRYAQLLNKWQSQGTRPASTITNAPTAIDLEDAAQYSPEGGAGLNFLSRQISTQGQGQGQGQPTGTSAAPSTRPAAAPAAAPAGAAKMPEYDFNETAARARQEAAIKTYTEEAQKQAREAYAEAKAAQEARAPYGKEREERIKEQQSGLSKRKDEAQGMLFLNMMGQVLSAPAGRGVAAALGQAITASMPGYKVDLDKIETLKEKLDDSMGRIEDVRYQMKEADSKELRQLKGLERQALMEGAKATVDLAKSFNIDIPLNKAKLIYEQAGQNYRTEREVSGRLQAAQIGASTKTAEERFVDVLGGGETGLRKLQDIKTAAKFNPTAAYADLLKSWAGKPEVIGKPPTYPEFLASFGMLPTVNTEKPNATVLPRKD